MKKKQKQSIFAGMISTRPTKLRPVRTSGHGKRGVRTQFGALCWRMRGGKPEVLLVTSRRTKRWIIPKGWPMNGETPTKAASQEAWEEAGVKGEASGQCLGIYSYLKDIDGADLPVIVAVFPVEVHKQKAKFPEARERKVKWMRPKRAAKSVAEPELRDILRSFPAFVALTGATPPKTS